MTGAAEEDGAAARAVLDGLPLTAHHPATAEGQIEQAGKIAAGLRAGRTGWRRSYVRLAGALLAVLVAVAVIALLSTG